MSCDLTLDAIRPTVGSFSNDLIVKEPETRSPIEQMRESLTDYEKNLLECVDRGKLDIPGDFYVVVITKKEPLMHNVMRNYFGFRLSCPTPDYDQAVYHYDRQDDKVEFLWIIPARDICFDFLTHRLEIPKEEWGLLENVLKFESGELMIMAKKRNKEIV